jgi:hypothetical protein
MDEGERGWSAVFTVVRIATKEKDGLLGWVEAVI